VPDAEADRERGEGSSSNRWIAVRVDPGSAREEALAALFASGAQGVHEDGRVLVTHYPPGTDVDRVRGAGLTVAPGADIAIAPADDTDWSMAWKSKLGAHRLRTLVVAPPWLADEQGDVERTIVIDPGMAFGTGEHATTRGVIRLMHDVVRPGDLVADLGAGSAVLSIAAAKLGARRAIAIELDADAIGNAEENVARNRVAEIVGVIEGDAASLLPLVAPVDVVLANIISSVLLELMPVIAGALAAGGRIILSGILLEERETMLAALDEAGWRVLDEDHEDVWWSVAADRA
jgi:ribosomal protein L11 methyltransferase